MKKGMNDLIEAAKQLNGYREHSIAKQYSALCVVFLY